MEVSRVKEDPGQLPAARLYQGENFQSTLMGSVGKHSRDEAPGKLSTLSPSIRTTLYYVLCIMYLAYLV